MNENGNLVDKNGRVMNKKQVNILKLSVKSKLAKKDKTKATNTVQTRPKKQARDGIVVSNQLMNSVSARNRKNEERTKKRKIEGENSKGTDLSIFFFFFAIFFLCCYCFIF